MLELKRIHKTYRIKGAPDTHALVDINLKFPSSGLVFVLGKSGCGKSTLLNVMGGLDKHDSGEIVIKGKSSNGFKGADFDSYRNTYLGFIFQEYNVIEDFTIERNIALALDLQHKKSSKADVDAILHEVELDGYNNRFPNQISGGQKQRVAIARALIKNPQIILADEPTGALDSGTGIQIFELLKKLSKDKLVVVVSHDREFAEGFGDRVIELRDGRVIHDITKVNAGFADTADTDIIDGVALLRDGARILTGSTLNEKHLELLNQRLRDNKEYTISVVEDESKLKSVNESGTTQFLPTDNAAIDMQTGGFKLIKSKLPGKDARRIAMSSLRHKRVRLVFTILLSFLSVAFFGFSDMVGQFKPDSVLLRAMTDYGYKHMRVDNSMNVEVKYYEDYISVERQSYPFTDQKLEQFNNLSGSKYAKISNAYISAGFRSSSVSQYYGMDNYLGIVQVEDEFANFGLDIPAVYGRQPRSGTNEVAISNYMAECYMERGMIYNENGIEMRKDSFQKINDIVNYQIMFENKPVVITGIINFNIAQFYPLKAERNNVLNYRLSCEFEYTLGHIYGADGILDYLGKQNSLSYVFMLNMSGDPVLDNAQNNVYNGTFQLSDELDNTGETKPLWFPTDYTKTFYYGEGKTEYAEPKADEILLHAGYLDMLSGGSGMIDAQAAFNKYASMIGKTINIDVGLYRGYTTNSMTGYTVASIRDIKIIGLFHDGSMAIHSIINRNFFSAVPDALNPVSVMLYVPDRADREAIFNDIATDINVIQKGMWTDRIVNIPPSNEVRSLAQMFNYFVIIFLVISLVFAFFSVLLMLNFISTSISYKKKEIGILRALGARKMDVLRIFLWEGTFIGIWIMALASVLVFTSAVIMNAMSKTIATFELVLVLFDIRQLLLMMLLTAGTIVFASALPVGRISSRNPIDAIRARQG